MNALEGALQTCLVSFKSMLLRAAVALLRVENPASTYDSPPVPGPQSEKCANKDLQNHTVILSHTQLTLTLNHIHSFRHTHNFIGWSLPGKK